MSELWLGQSAASIGRSYAPGPTVNDPGAAAHQLTLALAVDVTIWRIVRR